MTWWQITLAVYVFGSVAVAILGSLAIRGEPTAHGQIVGRQIGCLVALFWPFVLVWLIIVGASFVFSWLRKGLLP